MISDDALGEVEALNIHAKKVGCVHTEAKGALCSICFKLIDGNFQLINTIKEMRKMIENDNTMKYRGLTAGIHYGAEDRVFWGKVLGVTDCITFHGESVDELIKQFHDAVDGYIEVAREVGREDVGEVMEEEDQRLYDVLDQAIVASLKFYATHDKRSALESVALAIRSWQDKEGYEKRVKKDA